MTVQIEIRQTYVMLWCKHLLCGSTTKPHEISVHHGLFIETKLLSFLLAIFYLNIQQRIKPPLPDWNDYFEFEKRILEEIK